IADNGDNVLSLGDILRNDNDTINTGGVTTTYGMDGFGTVTTSAVGGIGGIPGRVAGAATIQDAIANTTVGGTVNVLEGTYDELVNVNKSVTLLGAQAGVDARTRTAVPESILRGAVNGLNKTTSFYITAANVT